MNKLLRLLITVTLVSVVFVAPLPSKANTPCKLAVSVTKPCEGVLLPSEMASEGLKCLQVELPRAKQDFEHNRALWGLEKLQLKGMLDLETKRADDLNVLLDRALQKGTPAVQEDPWYEHPALWVTVGFIVGTGTTIGIVYAVRE